MISQLSFLFETNKSSPFRYNTRSQRFWRIVTIVLFSYILLNGSMFSILGGLYWLSKKALLIQDPVWMAMAYGTLTLIVTLISVYVGRRIRLSFNHPKKSDKFFHVLTSFVFVASIALMVLAFDYAPDHKINFGWHVYWKIFLWTWQIPAGVFVGIGLNWSIQDRQIAGQNVNQVIVDDYHPDTHHHT